LVPDRHLDFLKQCRAYFETVGHIFVHAYYDPNLPLRQQNENGLRWAALPPNPECHYSGKVAVVGHRSQKSGEILDLGYMNCIDTYCHGGGWLTALEVQTGRVWQANVAGELRVEYQTI
jgi:serine/threonine protein phosphatase 1